MDFPGPLRSRIYLLDRNGMVDLAIITAILYGARYFRRVPESEGEKRGTITAAIIDAKLILAATTEAEEPDIRRTLARLLEAEPPEQPPPSPGTIGRIAEAKATRRRG
jgi:hypothetical protein